MNNAVEGVAVPLDNRKCFYLIALAAGGWWTIVSPLLMSMLLYKVSSVTLLEKDIGERRPAYRDYFARTSALFPRAAKGEA